MDLVTQGITGAALAQAVAPARLGRDQPHPADLVALQLLLADPQRLNGTRHG